MSTSRAPLPPDERWLITGVAGFIGSHLLQTLLSRDIPVTGLDNFSTGHPRNLEEVRCQVTPAQWARFRMVEGNITRAADVAAAMVGVRRVLHQAALGSVPLSIEDPEATHASNVTGFLEVLQAAQDAGVARVVYASSSAVYGDSDVLPAVEHVVGRWLSPYALSKAVDEQYADVFERCYGLQSVGLRYFNVFGPRQDPQGAYAAVIPRWIAALLGRGPLVLHGDGGQTRDFCPVQNIVEANLLAATSDLSPCGPRVFNVGLGRGMTLRELLEHLRTAATRRRPEAASVVVDIQPSRAGDIRHSYADTRRLTEGLGFVPLLSVEDGLQATVDWFAAQTQA